MPPPHLSDAVVDVAWARGQAAWPTVALGREPFAAYLRAHAATEAARGVPPESLQVEQLYLCCACLRRDAVALGLLEELLRAAVRGQRLRLSAADEDEVLQQLRQRLLVGAGEDARLARYTGRVPLGAWLRVIAVRIALDNVPATGAPRSLEELSFHEAEDPAPNPELDYLKTRYRESFSAAFATALEGLESEQQVLLRLHYVDGLSVDKLAPILGVHRATAARRLAAVRSELMERLGKALQQRLAISSSELHSLMAGAIPSEVDVSLRRLLAR